MSDPVCPCDPSPDPRSYDPARAAWIADQVGQGDSLRKLFLAFPDVVPPPMVVRRWAREHPQFGMLLDEAELSRAEWLADEALQRADSKRKAANTRNSILARQWVAAALNPGRYGARRILAGDPDNPLGGTTINVAVEFTDAQLLAIARGDRVEPLRIERTVGEQSTPREAPPVHPPHGAKGGGECAGGGITTPQKNSVEDFGVAVGGVIVGRSGDYSVGNDEDSRAERDDESNDL